MTTDHPRGTTTKQPPPPPPPSSPRLTIQQALPSPAMTVETLWKGAKAAVVVATGMTTPFGRSKDDATNQGGGEADNVVNVDGSTCSRSNPSTTTTRTDPRRQILEYFANIPVTKKNEREDRDEGADASAAVFTVWRPTSAVAIEKMVQGQATGKGLEIKGKSAKAGKLSGLVPYLQIHQHEHKTQVATLHRNGRTRIFFASSKVREDVFKRLEPEQQRMLSVVHDAKRTVKKTLVDGLVRPATRAIVQSAAAAAAPPQAVAAALSSEFQKAARSSIDLASAVALPIRISNSRRSSSGSLSNSSIGSFITAPIAAATGGMSQRLSTGAVQATHQAGRLSQRARSSLAKAAHQTMARLPFKNPDRENALKRLIWDMDDPSIRRIDDYAKNTNNGSTAPCYGIELPDRLLWKVFVMDWDDISRPPESDYYTARPSMPAFQDMNFNAIYKTRKHNVVERKGAGGEERKDSTRSDDDNDDDATMTRRVVLWQTAGGEEENEDEDPMDPRGLVMAYEEDGRVLPVVSDFDCFTMGTRGVPWYNTESQPSLLLPPDQVQLLEWCVSQIETVLEKQEENEQKKKVDHDDAASLSSSSSSSMPMSWTSCWLDVLKANAAKGFHPTVPPYGFGDGQSYKIMESAVLRLVETGAVRHGAECFNYLFPQDLDDEWLIVAGPSLLPGDDQVTWRYVGQEELQEFLMEKIDEGFTFPLNPKWVICDPGWKNIYDRLFASHKPHVQSSLDVWFPPGSGVRERIANVCESYPRGFFSASVEASGGDPDDLCGTEAMDLAMLEVDRFMALKRAKAKLRAVIAFNGVLEGVRRQRSIAAR